MFSTGRSSTQTTDPPLIRTKQQAVKVLVRVRPPKTTDCEVATEVEPGKITIPNPYFVNGSKTYTFDKVFGSDATQAQVFADVEVLLRDVFQGRNATVFAYGQTGSGKTHTMNAYTMAGTASQPCVVLQRRDAGITYRAVDWIFERKRTLALNVTVSASFVEIYNDEVYDLLQNTGPNGDLRKLKVLMAGRRVTVQGLSEEAITSSEEFESLFVVALKHRTTAGTKLNVLSSRSHFMVQLTIKTKNADKVLTSKLSLIDLAGSEDNRYTGNEGDRFDESRHINSSLFAIRSVVSALKDNKSQVPYRNSKITQLLCDSLGGSASALAVVCCAPERDNLQPTHNSLEFAKDCCFIKNCVEVNEMRRKSTASVKGEPAPSRKAPGPSSLKENRVYEPSLTLESVEHLIKPMVEKVLAERQQSGVSDVGPLSPPNVTTDDQQKITEKILNVMNTATLNELKKMKFIGPQRANKILAARDMGAFESPQDLSRIGIPADTLNMILQVNFQVPIKLV
ncbi:hypothetical protein HDU85_007300 [Gaertneriomyces sp. JEL0708]|nr:hypothetical protein HDU85_007300 [Gaertneriomyces sp. JEL0708]